MKRQLKNLGYHVDTANSGKETLEKTKKTQYDCAVIDQRMPGMDGLQLYHILEKNIPQLHCVMMSGHSEEISLLEADKHISANKTAVYPKPVSPTTLHEDFLKLDIREFHCPLQQVAFNRNQQTKATRKRLRGVITRFSLQKAESQDEQQL